MRGEGDPRGKKKKTAYAPQKKPPIQMIWVSKRRANSGLSNGIGFIHLWIFSFPLVLVPGSLGHGVNEKSSINQGQTNKSF
jgi:hypothetical protein